MTTYQYTISLNDREYIILEEILSQRVEYLKSTDETYKKLSAMGHLYTEEEILQKLKQSCSSAMMTSTSSFCNDNNLNLWSPSKGEEK